jgi:hypothetical protein
MMNVIQWAVIGFALWVLGIASYFLFDNPQVQESSQWCQTLCKNQVLSYTIKGDEKTCECKE